MEKGEAFEMLWQAVPEVRLFAVEGGRIQYELGRHLSADHPRVGEFIELSGEMCRVGQVDWWFPAKGTVDRRPHIDVWIDLDWRDK